MVEEVGMVEVVLQQEEVGVVVWTNIAWNVSKRSCRRQVRRRCEEDRERVTMRVNEVEVVVPLCPYEYHCGVKHRSTMTTTPSIFHIYS